MADRRLAMSDNACVKPASR